VSVAPKERSTMPNESDVMEPMVHQDQEPGHESKLEPKPDWEPRYKGSDRLKNKVALITGADSGIGRGIAALFAREGADVAIVYLCEHDDAAKTKAIVEKEGRKAITIAGDIGDKQFCEKAVQQTLDQLGRLDILVNNAGEQHPDKKVTEIDEHQLRRTFQTNIFGMFYMTQAAAPHLKDGAAIVICTSETTYKGSPDLLDYSATKGAIVGFTRSLAKNLVKKGIRVNGVAPGPIWTPLNPFGGQPKEDLPAGIPACWEISPSSTWIRRRPGGAPGPSCSSRPRRRGTGSWGRLRWVVRAGPSACPCRTPEASPSAARPRG
jgi:NAD(P)-dependent dehydrogenase (short-subunit alcohol dehydrogenase family)